MKIVLAGPDILFKGGIAQYNHFLANEIVRNGHELKFMGFKKQYPDFLYPSGSGNITVETEMQPLYSVDRIFHYANPFSALIAAAKVRKFKPDIIIVPHWIWVFVYLFVPFLLLLPAHTKIIIAHNSLGHGKNFLNILADRIASKLTFSLSNHIIVQSEEERKRTSSVCKTPVSVFNHPDYSQYLPLIPRDIARKNLGIDENSTVFLFLGFVRKYKGAELFASAIAGSVNAIGIIAGECFDKKIENELSELSSKCNRLIVMNRYFVSAEARTLISACDAMVLPYLSVTGSGIASIALACQKPVIASDLELFRDIFTNHPAILFKTGDLSELIEKINKFSSNEYILKYNPNPDNISSGNGWKGLLEHILKVSEAGNE